jgi:DNA polymerase
VSKLDAKQRSALAERVDFYRELGIHDFYRPAGAPEVSIQMPTEKEESPRELVVLQEELTGASAEDRAAALRAIRKEIGDCTRCKLHRGRKNLVFGVGNPHAELMFVGEGPGADEDEQGEPFVGRAGQLLNNMIAAMGLRREDVYIANIVKCRPPNNRQPERDECDTCSPFLLQQIAVVKPKLIVALGATAAKTLLSMNDSMANLRGRFYDFRGTKLLVTYHPAFLLRDPRQKKETWKDLQLAMQHLGLPIPEKSQQTES